MKTVMKPAGDLKFGDITSYGSARCVIIRCDIATSRRVDVWMIKETETPTLEKVNLASTVDVSVEARIDLTHEDVGALIDAAVEFERHLHGREIEYTDEELTALRELIARVKPAEPEPPTLDELAKALADLAASPHDPDLRANATALAARIK